MDGMLVILCLGGVRPILCIDDEDSVFVRQRNIALHYWKHGLDSVIESPGNLRGTSFQLRKFLAVILKDEFFIQLEHP